VSFRINTNVNALFALDNLSAVQSNLSTSIQRLSSGLRINSAADDPAGLVIASGLQAQVESINQAIANTQDATNVIKTADAGLAAISPLLSNIRALAVHAANVGASDPSAAAADQAQIQAALQSIDRIASQTQFGNKKLLDGSAGVTATVSDSTNLSGINIGSTFGGQVTQSGAVTITVNNAATRAQTIGTATYASVNSSLAFVNGTTTGSGGTVVINGQSITVTGSDTVQTLINKINNLASTTGVSANFSSANGSGTIVLSQQNYGANFRIVQQETATLINGTSGTNVAGLNATVTVVALARDSAGTTSAVTSTFIGGRYSSDSGLRVTDAYGNSILLTETGNSTAVSSKNVANIFAGNVQFQVGAFANQSVSISLGNVSARNLGTTSVSGSNLSTIDVTTVTGANNAITIVDEAISQISKQRSALGAFQTQTLNATSNFLNTAVSNVSASLSSIRDTNVAQEVVTLTKNQIIFQAGQSALAQANQLPSAILNLLR